LVHLFAGLNLQSDRLFIPIEFAARAFVERKQCIQDFGLSLGQPFDAVEDCRRFFAAGERKFDAAARLETLFPVTDQAVGEDRRHRFVVARPTRVEPAFFLDQLERIALPILALGFHDVDMREQQNGLGQRVAAV